MAILFAARPPVGGDGANTDTFIDTTQLSGLRLLVYGPKAAGAWPATPRVVAHGQIQITRDLPVYQGGQVGDFALRPSDSNKLYGPKVSAGTWAGPYTAAP